MMGSKTYTAEELRRQAHDFDEVLTPKHHIREVGAMLRQAADLIEYRDRAVESMHMQILLLANDDRRIVRVDKLAKYFAHVENVLYGINEGDAK